MPSQKKLFVLTVIACGMFALPLGGCQTTGSADHTIPEAEKNDITALKERGDSAMRAEKYETAYNAYKTALHLNKDDTHARFGLAESLLKLNSPEKAIENYEKIKDAGDYAAKIEQGIGLANLKAGNQLEAEEHLSSAVNIDPTLWRAWNGLAQIYDFQNMWEESDLAYSHALEHTPKEEFIYNNLGVSYMAQERFDEAEKAFKQAMRYDPDLQIAETNYKLALAMQSKYDEATLENNETDKAKSLNNAGYAAMLQGDYGEAEKLFLKAIEVNPSFYKAAYNNLQVLYKLKKG